MKVAVIGCGTIANTQHIPAYLANEKAEIKYFCDIIPERAEKAVEKYGCGIAITDYKVALADPEIEAVSVCTPNNVHPQISIDAMRAGKDVLCEKPSARTYEEALTMQKVQHETGRVLNIGVCNRFHNGIRTLKKLIDDGMFGDIFHVYVSFRAFRSIPGLGGDFTNKEVAGGGVLIDWGVHFFDIVMYCCGDPVAKTVSAEEFKKLGGKFAFATGRDPFALLRVVPAAGEIANFPCIVTNGAYSYDFSKNTPLDQHPLNRELLFPIFDEIL